MTTEGSAVGAGSPPNPTWTILVATLGQRRELFARLLDVLLPQTEPYAGAVKVLAYWNNGHPPLSEVRQRLVEAADTDYLCFVDDDDLVPDYYVTEVIAALRAGPDYVGWHTEFRIFVQPHRREVRKVIHHSLRYGGWFADRFGMYRDVTHVNPVRTALAQQADFRVAGAGEAEDKAWVAQMRPLLRTEVVVGRVMYHYLYDRAVSAWERPDLIQRGPFEPVQPTSPHFSYHPDCEAAG